MSTPAKPTCLIVDASAVHRKMARRIVEALGFTFTEAHDGDQALTACKQKMPDAILLDSSMAKVNAYEFLRVLRSLPGGNKPKALFCTTENTVAPIARALHAGANEWIFKPFDRETVEAKLQEVGLI